MRHTLTAFRDLYAIQLCTCPPAITPDPLPPKHKTLRSLPAGLLLLLLLVGGLELLDLVATVVAVLDGPAELHMNQRSRLIYT